MGETQLTFAGSRARANGGPRKNPIAAVRMRAAIIACATLAILGVALTLWMDRAQKAAQREAQARAELAALFRAAKELVRQGQWDQATERVERIHQRAPDYPGAQAYLDRSKTEIPNQQHLTSARAALARNELATAALALAKVTADTQQHQQLAAVQNALNDRLERRLAEARKALADRQPEAALLILEDLVRAFPDHGEPSALAKRARQEMAKRSGPSFTERGGGVWEPAVKRYRRGDLSQAIELANRCASAGTRRCQRLLKRMREVQQLSRAIDRLDVPRLERLLALDREMGGEKGTPVAAPAMARTADLYYKRAAAANAAGQWARAMEFAGKTLATQPGHPEAAAMVSEMKARAREQFLLAYSLKDNAPEEALRRLREVLAMTPAGDPTHLKAAGWIEKLSR